MDLVSLERHGSVAVVTINRPEVRNAVDGPTARALADAVRAADADPAPSRWPCSPAQVAPSAPEQTSVRSAPRGRIALLPRATAQWVRRACGSPHPPSRRSRGTPLQEGSSSPCWCDLRVAAETAVFGVFSRRFGVPLVDGGTVRLPRLIGRSRSLDLILTGRSVGAREADAIGLVNRVVPEGEALGAAVALAAELSVFPQARLRSDRAALYDAERTPRARRASSRVRARPHPPCRRGAPRSCAVRGQRRAPRALRRLSTHGWGPAPASTPGPAW